MKKTFKKLLTASFALALAIGTGVLLGSKSNGEVKTAEATDRQNTIRVYVDLGWNNINYVRIGGNTDNDNAVLTKDNPKFDTTKGKYVKDINTSSIYDKMGLFFDEGGTKWEYQYDGGYIWIDNNKWQPGKAYRIYNINHVADGNPKKFSASAQCLGDIPADPYTPGMYITGDFGECNWDVAHSVNMTKQNNQYVGTIDLEIGDSVKLAGCDGGVFDSYHGYSQIIEGAEALFCFSKGEGDNILCWASGTYTFYFGFDGTKISVTYVSANAEILAAKLMSYGKADEIPQEGKCKSEGWFTTVKTMYNGLDDGEKTIFQGFATSDVAQFRNAYDRYVAWARANGEIPFANGTVNQSALSVLGINSSNSSTVIIVIAAALLTAAVCGGYFFYRKKKQN